MALFPSPGGARALTDVVDTSKCYSACFLVQIKIHFALHFDAALSPIPLLPPSIPSMNPASQYDEPYELGSALILWPWLRDGLAGTPLAGLSSGSGHRWAGYYTLPGGTHDPQMFFKLYLVPPPAADEPEAAHKMYFYGEGSDGVGSFKLEGSSDTQNGVVIARKIYVGSHLWEWLGMITPFGMVGVWGFGTERYGWWWIWPQEWSEWSITPAATVTQ
ncbi:hypothetical protein EI94DRAFT_184556 [Lactarius quietus]|nr:hypothetical protein EI94DRAFT_184556 [Lactarius quietus]